MRHDRIEGKWIDAFQRVFALCELRAGDAVAILSETQSRPINVQLAELALHRLGARAVHVIVPTPQQRAPVAVRSTGASDAVQGLKPVIAACAASTLVVDLTVEGMLHAPELPAILEGGARLLMVSNEHPEALERLTPDPALEGKVKAAYRMLRDATEMRVTSPAGTDLAVNVDGALTAGVWGWCTKPGSVAHWPGGLVLCFPKAGTVNGRLVLAPGDANLTFKRYLATPVTLTVENDYVTAVDGGGPDAIMMRDYFAAWGDREAYGVSHVGWGMNPAARWEALEMYDKRDTNGTELRAVAGSFLYSTGANETAGRHTLGHFDLPMRGCTVTLDDAAVVRDGALQGELA
ncbi:MAG: 2,5-dihydroxypyridine 5,6-dioxygenase [Rhodospirillales bacterium]|nr:MAG: 2,5-dihydroxypyridine 5,6-dioxygenase [Rhodospirillales bacterium]